MQAWCHDRPCNDTPRCGVCELESDAHWMGARHMTTPQPFLDALVSTRRAPELAETDEIFGFLIGSGDLEAVLHDGDGQTQTRRGELHVARVLEGRAIQDLFIFTRRADRAAGVPAQGDRYATTIRTYDRMRRAWRVEFINPADDATSARLLARRNGHGITMEGALSDGTPIRWRYEAITPISFHYSAEQRADECERWRLYLELFGTRNGA